MRLLDPGRRADAARLISGALGTPVRAEADPASLSVSVADAERASEAVLQLTRSGVAVAGFSLGQPSLDEVFLALTGRPAEDEATATEEEQAA